MTRALAKTTALPEPRTRGTGNAISMRTAERALALLALGDDDDDAERMRWRLAQIAGLCDQDLGLATREVRPRPGRDAVTLEDLLRACEAARDRRVRTEHDRATRAKLGALERKSEDVSPIRALALLAERSEYSAQRRAEAGVRSKLWVERNRATYRAGKWLPSKPEHKCVYPDTEEGRRFMRWDELSEGEREAYYAALMGEIRKGMRDE